MLKNTFHRWYVIISNSVLNSWYGNGWWTRLLLPLAWLYTFVAQRHRKNSLSSVRWVPPVPILIVGNITIGGTGKTPVVSSLVERLVRAGYHPGIASRGFGSGNGVSLPAFVTADSDPSLVGDEPVMLAQQLQVPVMVDPQRVLAAKALIDKNGCDLIIADDGLQHYKLDRHIEVVVIDGQRMLGNGLSIPAGPLREMPKRLKEVDQELINGFPEKQIDSAYDCFYLATDALKQVSGSACSNAPAAGTVVHGVAGIGNPERFFKTLQSLGFKVIPHAFPDHHAFVIADIQFYDKLPVIMTEKDAVKCRHFAQRYHWYLPIRAQVPEAVFKRILTLIETKGPQRRLDKETNG